MKRALARATKSVSHAGHVKTVTVRITSGNHTSTGKVTVKTK